MAVSLPQLPSLPRLGAQAAITAPRQIDPALIEEYLRQTQQRGALGTLWSGVSNIFDIAARPAYFMGNLAAGEPTSAIRSMVPFGNVLENMTGLNVGMEPKERRLVSETIGLPKSEPWYARVPINLGIDIASDPTTYLTMGLTQAGKAAASVGKGLGSLDDAVKLLNIARQTGNTRQVAKIAKAIPVLRQAVQKFGPDAMHLAPTWAQQAVFGQRALLKWAGMPIVKGTKVFKLLGRFGNWAKGTKGGQILMRGFSTKTGVSQLDELVESARGLGEMKLGELDETVKRLSKMEKEILKTHGPKGMADVLEHADVPRRSAQLAAILKRMPGDVQDDLYRFYNAQQALVRGEGPASVALEAAARLEGHKRQLGKFLAGPDEMRQMRLFSGISGKSKDEVAVILKDLDNAMGWLREGTVHPAAETLAKLDPTQTRYVEELSATFKTLLHEQWRAGKPVGDLGPRYVPHMVSEEARSVLLKKPFSVHRAFKGSVAEFNELVDNSMAWATGREPLKKPLGDLMEFAREFKILQKTEGRADFFLSSPTELLARYGEKAHRMTTDRWLEANVIKRFQQAKIPLHKVSEARRIMSDPSFAGSTLYVPTRELQKITDKIGGDLAALLRSFVAEVGPDSKSLMQIPFDMLAEKGVKAYGHILPIEVVQGLSRARHTMGPGLPEILGVFDKIQGVWKAHTLAYFPARHARDMVSDLVRAGVAGMSPARVLDAMKVRFGQGYKIAVKTKTGVKMAVGDDIIRLAKRWGAIDTGWSAEVISQLSSKPGRFARTLGKESPIVKAGMKFTRERENLFRMAMFMDGLEQGFKPIDAAKRTTAVFYDYRHLAPMDKFFRKFLPFYTFMRRNIPYQLKIALTKPGYPAAIAKASQVTGAEEAKQTGQMPEWLQQRMPIKVGERVFPLEGYLAMADLVKLQRPVTAMTEQISPFLKTPVELAQNRSWYFGRDIQRVPGEKKQFLGMDVPVGAEYVGRSLRPLAETHRLVSPALKQPVAERAARAVTGVRLYPIDRSRRARELEYQRIDHIRRLRSAYGAAYRRGDTSEIRRLGSMLTALSAKVPEVR